MSLEEILGQDAYKSFFDLAPVGIVLVDKKGSVLQANTRLLDWTGYDPSKIKGKNLATMPFLTNFGKIEVMKKFAQRMLGKDPEPYILDFVSKDKKETRKGLIIAKAIKDSKGKIQADLVMIPDVTLMGGIKDKLDQSEQEFRKVFDNSAIGMTLVSPKGMIKKANQALCDMLGYSESELLKKSFQDLTHPDDLDKDLAYVKKMLTGKIKTYQLEKRYLHKKGNVVWGLLSVSLIKDANEKPIHFISQVQDITESKKDHEVLEKKLSEVEKINKLMIGREIEMVKLKEKIKKLESKK